MFEAKFDVIAETLGGGILDDPSRVAKSLKHVGKRVKESNIIEELLEAQRDEARSYTDEPLSYFG